MLKEGIKQMETKIETLTQGAFVEMAKRVVKWIADGHAVVDHGAHGAVVLFEDGSKMRFAAGTEVVYDVTPPGVTVADEAVSAIVSGTLLDWESE